MSGCQKTGRGVGPQGDSSKAPVWELDYCREGEWGRGLRRNRILPITQMQQTVALEARGHDLQRWAQKLGPVSAYLDSLNVPGHKQSVTGRENQGLSVAISSLCSQVVTTTGFLSLRYRGPRCTSLVYSFSNSVGRRCPAYGRQGWDD